MKLGLIGVGLGGTMIADTLYGYDNGIEPEITGGAVAINTSERELHKLTHIELDHRVLVGQTQIGGSGCGRNARQAVDVANSNLNAIHDALEECIAVRDIDAFLIATTTGGGTGAGMAPILLRHLDEVYNLPTYVVGVLPDRESDSLHTINSACSLPVLSDAATSVILFDNDYWSDIGRHDRVDYPALNDIIVKRLGSLFASDAGVIDGDGHPGTVQLMDIVHTLDDANISTLGYASESINQLPRPLSWIRQPDDIEVFKRLTSVTEQALEGRFTIQASPHTAQSALLILAGPRSHLIESGRKAAHQLVEDATESCDVRSGLVATPDTDHVSATLVLSGINDVPRVSNLHRQAAQTDIEVEHVDGVNEDDYKAVVEG